MSAAAAMIFLASTKDQMSPEYKLVSAQAGRATRAMNAASTSRLRLREKHELCIKNKPRIHYRQERPKRQRLFLVLRAQRF
jgi:hypothetical protein